MERFHVVPKAYRRCLPDAAKTRKCHDGKCACSSKCVAFPLDAMTEPALDLCCACSCATVHGMPRKGSRAGSRHTGDHGCAD
jgi:hypothetical protein